MHSHYRERLTLGRSSHTIVCLMSLPPPLLLFVGDSSVAFLLHISRFLSLTLKRIMRSSEQSLVISRLSSLILIVEANAAVAEAFWGLAGTTHQSSHSLHEVPGQSVWVCSYYQGTSLQSIAKFHIPDSLNLQSVLAYIFVLPRYCDQASIRCPRTFLQSMRHVKLQISFERAIPAGVLWNVRN